MPDWGPLLSPNGGTQDAIINSLWTLPADCRIMTNQYWRGPIHDMLILILGYGAGVRMILDKRQRFLVDIQVDELRAAGGQVRFDKKHPAMHANTILCGDGIFWVGSYMLCDPSELKYCECTFKHFSLTDEATLADYFEVHWEHSVES